MVVVVRKGDPNALKRLEKIAKELDGTDLKIGWFETNKYPNEKGRTGPPVAYVATIHEFGDPGSGIPARPFMRPTVAREEENWRRFIDQEAKKIIAGTQTVEGMFEALGLNVSGEIARSIAMVFAPALKEETIRRKAAKMRDQKTVGSLDKPLVETGLMLDSVTHVVEKG